ncbi:MAG: hypothetical protein QW314_05820 [Thermoproteota archaeon]|nr:hypothetical protein [Candidatus Brockarchaeota archaeon]
MEKRALLYPILAVLLGISFIILPSFLVKTNTPGKVTTFSKSSEAQEINKSSKVANTYLTESKDILQNLFLILLIPLVFSYLAFKLAKNKYIFKLT